MRSIVLWACLAMTSIVQAQVIDIPDPGSTPTRTLLIATDAPKATVLLLPGGDGMAGIYDNGSVKSNHTFVRSQTAWSQYGLNAVLIDSSEPLPVKNGIRLSEGYQQRLLSVVQFYKSKFNVPVWLFGHSNGTVSASGFANQHVSSNLIAGIIIAGTRDSVVVDRSMKLPVLAIHHLKDGCAATPMANAEALIKNRPPESRAQWVTLDGGMSVGNPCGSMAYHGFNQTENELIGVAAKFIIGE